MKKHILILILFQISSFLYAGGSIGGRHEYMPTSQTEQILYNNINKNIWPNDVIENIELYKYF